MRSKLARYVTNLQHFATVVEHGNISSASSALCITQPALTRSIIRLEEVLGAPLLTRSTKGVSPTPCGQALLRHIQAVETELNQALATVQAIRGINDGRINCGAGAVSMNHILPGAVSRMKRRQDKVRINLIEGRTHELLARLRNCELDLVLGIEQSDGAFADLCSERLVEEQFQFCVRAGHPLAGRPELDLRELVHAERMVIPVLESTPVKDALDHELARNDCELGDYCVETLSHAVMRQLIYEDGYVAFCSSLWFREDIRSGKLKVLQGNWSTPQFGTMLFRRRDDVPTPWMSQFVDEIKQVAAGLGVATAATAAAAANVT